MKTPKGLLTLLVVSGFASNLFAAAPQPTSITVNTQNFQILTRQDNVIDTTSEITWQGSVTFSVNDPDNDPMGIFIRVAVEGDTLYVDSAWGDITVTNGSNYTQYFTFTCIHKDWHDSISARICLTADDISQNYGQLPPIISAGTDTVVSQHDTLIIHATGIDPFGSIVKWELDIGATGVFVEVPAASVCTTVVDSIGFSYHVLRATDNLGIMALDTLEVFSKGAYTGQKQGRMVLIPAGMFVDDVSTGWSGDTAFISYNYWMDTTTVTQEHFSALVGRNPSQYTGALHPVERVTFYDAVIYCNARSKAEFLDTVYTFDSLSRDSALNLVCHFDRHGYRLPTSDEWEHAARAGIQLQFPTADGTNAAGQSNNNWDIGQTCDVASYLPHMWNLYDMEGNVLQWCQDGFISPSYADPDRKNRRRDYCAPYNGIRSFRRGSQWMEHLRSAAYWNGNENINAAGIRGFRVVLPVN